MDGCFKTSLARKSARAGAAHGCAATSVRAMEPPTIELAMPFVSAGTRDASHARRKRLLSAAGSAVAGAACGSDHLLDLRTAAADARRMAGGRLGRRLFRARVALVGSGNAERGWGGRGESAAVLVDAGLRVRAFTRSALAALDVHHHRRRLSDRLLFDRLHGRRSRLCALLRLHELLRLRDAYAGALPTTSSGCSLVGDSSAWRRTF